MLKERPELARWFDPVTGKYKVKKVKVRSQLAQERALSRLSNATNGSTATSLISSMKDFEKIDSSYNGKAIEASPDQPAWEENSR